MSRTPNEELRLLRKERKRNKRELKHNMLELWKAVQAGEASAHQRLWLEQYLAEDPLFENYA